MKTLSTTTTNLPAVKKEVDYCPYLNEKQREVVKAVRLSPKCVKRRFDDQVKARFFAVINAAFQNAKMLAGFKAHEGFEPEEQDIVINGLVEVVDRNAWMTIEELEFIFANGLAGTFDKENDKSYALNARFLTYWIREYEEKFRQPAMKQQMMFEERIAQEMEAEESRKKGEQARKQNCQKLLDLYEWIKETKPALENIPDEDWLVGFYHTFERKEIVRFERENKNMIWSQEIKKARLTAANELFAKAKAERSSKLILIKSKLVTMAKKNIDLKKIFDEKQVWEV